VQQLSKKTIEFLLTDTKQNTSTISQDPRTAHTHTDLHELTNLKQQQSRVVDELETKNRAESKKEKKAKKKGGEGPPKKKKGRKIKNIP
jgi:hypothetical protein